MEVENFFGCYMLYSLNEKYKGRTYIGFTVDPNRRIKQHNKGLKAGGAWKTSSKGPWEMVLIVHGFPNDISALRFEWAWQHPEKSRRLCHLGKKTKKETSFQHRFRVMTEMLQLGPWNRLPLTVRWLNEKYQLNFEISKLPPLHMPICKGPVKCQKLKKVACENDNSFDENFELTNTCFVCKNIIRKEERMVCCFYTNCKTKFHIVCLAKHCLGHSSSHKFLIPVESNCASCGNALLWGELVRYSVGCYKNFPGLYSEEL